MRIIYIHQHFCTNEGSAGTRSYDVSRYLAEMGHEVTMICGVFDIGGFKRGPWYKLFQKYRMDGFDVIICNVFYSNHHGSLRRLWSFLWFAFLATIAALSVPKPDLVFPTHTPLTVGIPGVIVSWIKRVPFIFEVRDLWPEGFITTGLTTEKNILIRIMAALESFLLKHADKILLVSKGFEDRLVERGYPPEKLKTIFLGADGDIFLELKPDEEFRRKHRLANKTVAVYTGAHGWANGLDYILDAADCLKDRDDIVFMMIGEGREKPRLKKRVEEMGLANVRFIDAVSKIRLPELLAVCNIGLMLLRNCGPRRVTPNKIFDYMFIGLPSIVNFTGPTLEMVEADRTGVFVDPGKPEELAHQVVYWAEHPDEAKAIGRKAREIAYAKYDRRKIAKQLADTFEQVCEQYKSGKTGSR
jgi:glycosyltransferase involved in cell wall biosynthesis